MNIKCTVLRGAVAAFLVIVFSAVSGSAQLPVLAEKDFEGESVSWSATATGVKWFNDSWSFRCARSLTDTTILESANGTTAARLDPNKTRFQWIASPALTANLGSVSFMVSTSIGTTNMPSILNVYLFETNGIGGVTADPPESPVKEILLAADTPWTNIVIELNRYDIGGKSVVIGRNDDDNTSLDRIYIDNIVLRDAPSKVDITGNLHLDNGTEACFATNAVIWPELDVVQSGTGVRNLSAKLFWRKSGDASFMPVDMVLSEGVFSLADGLPVGSIPGSQIEMFVEVEYDDEIAHRKLDSFSAQAPLYIDVLPVHNETSIAIDDGFSASLAVSSNYTWVGGMELGDAGELLTYCVKKSGADTRFGKTGVLPPFGFASGLVAANSSFTRPASISRDVIFAYSELLGGCLSVEYGSYQSFENWETTGTLLPGGGFAVGSKWGAGSGTVLSNDVQSAQFGSASAVLDGSSEGYVVSPVNSNGVYKAGFWFRSADAAAASVTLEKIMSDGSAVVVKTFTGTHSLLYRYVSAVILDPAAVAVRIRSSAPAFIDGIGVTDISSVRLTGATTAPFPMIATQPATGQVSLAANYGALLTDVKLFYKTSTNTAFVSETDALVMNEDGSFYRTSLYKPIPARSDDSVDFQYYIRARFRNWDGSGSFEVCTATNLLPVVPYRHLSGMSVTGGITEQMFSAKNLEWRGIFAPAASMTGVDFRFAEVNAEGTATNYFGDSSAESVPCLGTVRENETFSGFAIDRPLVFAFDESDGSYVLQKAYYNSLDNASNGSGWSFSNTSGTLDRAKKGSAVRFTTNGSIMLTKDSSDPRGIGTIGFWAMIAPGLSGSASFKIQTSTSSGGSWMNVAGGSGTILKSTYRYYEVNVANSDATYVKITFNGADVLVDEVSVTDVGAYISFGSPFYVYKGVSIAPKTYYQGQETNIVDFGTVPDVGITITNYNNALITGVNIGYVSLGGAGRTNRTELVDCGSGVYSNSMPYLAAGPVRYWYEISYTGVGAPSEPVRYPENENTSYYYVTGTSLSSDRQPDYSTLEDGEGDINQYDSNERYWLYYRMTKRNEESRNAIIFPQNGKGSITSYANFNGIGTIYFKAWATASSENANLLQIVLISGGEEKIIGTIDVPASSSAEASLFRIVLNNYERDLNLRFIRTSVDSEALDGDIALSDLVVSPPPANVYVTEPKVISPGYPSRDDDVTFSLAVQTRPGPYPASEFDPTLYWQWIGAEGSDDNEWHPVKFVKTGEENGVWNFEYTLPHEQFQRLTGDIRYYSRIDFTGASYEYSGTDCGTNVVISEQCNPAWLGYDQTYRTNMLFLTEANAPDKNHMREFGVRMFRSMNESFRLYRDDQPGVYDEMDLVGDHVWQCISIFTNTMTINAHFQGLFAYTNGADQYSREVDFWTDLDNENYLPPMNGEAYQAINFDDATNNAINIHIPYKDTYMFRITATNGAYQVRLATAQNFDTWQASDEYFEESLGLLEVENYITELSEIGATKFQKPLQTFYGAQVTPPSEYNDVQDFSIQGWYGENAWCIQEAGMKEPTLSGFNHAILLRSGPGYVRSGMGVESDGRDFFSFNHRVSFGGDDHVAYYKNGFDKKNYRLTTQAVVSQSSGNEPHFEIMPYYYDESNYYKLSVKYLSKGNSPSNGRVETRFVRVKNGVETTLSTTTSFTNMYNSGSSVRTVDLNKTDRINGTWDIDIAIMEPDPSVTNEFLRIEVNAICPALGNNATNSFLIRDKFGENGVGNCLTNGGTVAFNVFDTLAVFTDLKLFDLDRNTPLTNRLAVGEQDLDFMNDSMTDRAWELGGVPYGELKTGARPSNLKSASSPTETVALSKRWKLDRANGIHLYRPIPIVPYTLTQYRTDSEENIALPDMSPGQWETILTGTSSSLNYNNAKKVMKVWDYTFVRVRPTYADADLVVDEFDSRDWRGLVISDLDTSDTPVTPADTNVAWVAYEAIISTNNAKQMVELTRSRANPYYKQMIVSPVLDDGMGTMAFSYSVTGGPVDFVVERPRFSGRVDYSRREIDPDNWQEELRVEANAGDSGTEYVVVRTNMVGRLRLRVIDKGAEDDNSTLWVGDIHITSYPDKGVTSWEAYNILVNTPTSAEKTATDGKYFELDLDHKSAFLNNSQTEDTRQLLFEFQPYVQSPEIRTGIGEISFWYRTWDAGLSSPGKLKLEMAPSANGPWTDVVPNSGKGNEALDIEYQNKLDSLQNIRNETYEYFMIEIFNESNKVLRISCDTNSSARVAIDNIVVTEPVRSSIDVLEVRLSPDIPLAWQEIGVEVQLGNPRMNPVVNEVTFEYYLGTNVWGVKHWETLPELVSVPLVVDPSDPTGMRYISSGRKIPGQEVDSVVQWRVKVDYTGKFASPVTYTDFENPEWYEPVDLNLQFGGDTNSDFWSPYYFVFSCSTGMVYFNEIFYAMDTWDAEANTEYVELIGQKNAPIGNWMLDVVESEGSALTDNVRVTYRIPADSIISQNPTDSNWAFYLFGDADDGSISEKVDFVFPDGGNPNVSARAPAEERILPSAGGFRLRRSMGAYVDRISYGDSDIAEYTMPERGYTYTTYKGSSSSQRVRTILRTADNDEGTTLIWTKQLANSKSAGSVNVTELVLLPQIEAFAEQGDPVSELINATIRNIQYMSQGRTRMTIYAETAIVTAPNFDGWTLLVQTNSSLENRTGWGDLPQTNGLPYTISGSNEGGAHEYPYDMQIPEDADVMFFRVLAQPPVR